MSSTRKNAARVFHAQERLAIFLPALYGGGAERAALNLAFGFAHLGIPVDLVLAQAKGPFLSEVPDSVNIVDLKASRVLTSLPALVRYLRHTRPKTILAELRHANIIALWARRLVDVPTRVIVCEQNTLSRSVRHSSSRLSRLMPPIIGRFYLWADGIVAVSEGVADDLVRVTGIPRERIQVIYNPVVTHELREKAQDPLEHPWFNPGEPPVVLGVGRLTDQKDFPTLIKAFAQVRYSRPARLMILGEGKSRPALETLVRRLGLDQDVTLPGFVENPYPYMAHAAVFVLSSRWEGLPTVLIESLYCGACVIATDCPGGAREILKDGQYGQLVPVGDAGAMAEAIEASLNGRALRPPRESSRSFELETVVSNYVNLLMEISSAHH